MNYKIKYIEDPNQFLKDNMHQEIVAWDTETSGINHFADDFRVGCITMCFDGVTGYYLPFDKINKRLLNKFFKGKFSILANAKYDIKAMIVNGVTTAEVHEDVILLYHVLNTMRKHNNLKALSWLIGFGGYDQELEDYKSKYKINNYLDIPESILVKYATLDAIVTYRLYEHAKKNLIPKQPDVYKMYKDILIPVYPLYIEMETEGIDVDIDYLNKLDAKYREELKEMEKEILEMIGKHININSSEQLAKEFERLKFPCLGRTKKGLYATGVENLKVWKKDGHELAEKVLNHRKKAKLISGFIGNLHEEEEGEGTIFGLVEDDTGDKEEGIAKHISKNNKIHPSYGIAMTDPFRQKCSDPNIQQFPNKSELRKIFKLQEDYSFAEFDISGFHLRLMAFYSKDPEMRNAFLKKGMDLHSKTACSIFMRNVTIDKFLAHKKEEPYATYRFRAKGVNFTYIYNGSPKLLKPVIELEWTEDEIDRYIKDNRCRIGRGEEKSFVVAKDIHKQFMNTYGRIPVYAKEQIRIAKNKGYLETMFGSKRHLPELRFDSGSNDYSKELSSLYNICTNTEILTTEALMMTLAMTEIYKEFKARGLKSKFLMMIHDSIVIKLYKGEEEEVTEICTRCLGNFDLDGIPIEVDYAIGDTWGH